MKKNIRLNLETEMMIYLFENNIPIYDIAKYFGRNPATIYRRFEKIKPKQRTIEDLLEKYILNEKKN